MFFPKTLEICHRGAKNIRFINGNQVFHCLINIFKINRPLRPEKYPYLACELITKNIVNLAHFFVKNKSCESSQRTIVESRKLLRGNSSADEDCEIIQKLSVARYDNIMHKASKETEKLQDQQRFESVIDFDDDDENEFMRLFFSGLNEDSSCLFRNETVCGYFQKTFSALMSQIRGDVDFLIFFFLL